MTMNAPNLAGRKPLSREVSMRQRTASVEPQPVPVKSGQTQEADVGKKLRVNKRKQLSPKSKPAAATLRH